MDAKSEKAGDNDSFKQIIIKKKMMGKQKINMETVGGVVVYAGCLVFILLFIVNSF